MAKLQKSLQQRKHHSMRARTHVAKLSPAEIRSLNHSALASHTGSQSSSKGVSPATSRRISNATPPTTPETPSAYQAPPSRTSSVNLPTPPQSPNRQHRSLSQSSAHSHGHGHIHAPRPRGSGQAAFMAANGLSSSASSPRPSSSSSYRGLPTYRGPEMTRTGSLTMLQRPSPNIVANPLSNFSRPRQSMVNSSPDRYKQASQEVDTDQTQNLRHARNNSLPRVSALPSREPSPLQRTDSPVSIEGEPFPPESFPMLHDTKAPTESPVDADADPNEPQPSDTPRKAARQKRFSLGPGFFDKGDKGEKSTFLKRPRRRTLSFTPAQDAANAANAVPKPESAPDSSTEKAEPRSDQKEAACGDVESHPAAPRATRSINAHGTKGKAKEIFAGTVYARCPCCGKLKRPPGYTGELSPVLEHETVRPKFSFEIDRTSSSIRSRSSDTGQSDWTAIIPPEVGEETCQAAVESPMSPNRADDANRCVNTSPTTSIHLSEPPTFVRFASLHGRRNTASAVIKEEDEHQPVAAADHHFYDMAVLSPDIKVYDFATARAEEQQPLLDDDQSHATPESPHQTNFTVDANSASAPDPAATIIGNTPANGPVQAGKDDTRIIKDTAPETPSGAVSTTAEELTSSTESQKTLSGQKSFLGLPEPQLGPHFARSNATLRDFVLLRQNSTINAETTGLKGVDGGVSTIRIVERSPDLEQEENNVLEGLEGSRVLDEARQKGQKWIAEVMAV